MRTLAVLELVNIGLIAWAVFWALELPTSTANLVGYALVTLYLVIGAAYWLVKGRQVRDGLAHPPMIGVFRWLGLAGAVALVAGFVVIAASFARQPDSTTVPGLILFALALAEHVNYFHRQLMHDTLPDLHRLSRTRRLHRSHLNIDLRAARNVR